MSIIKLRVAAYLALAESRGHDTFEQQATAAGLGVATIHRLRNGGAASSPAIARLLDTYGVDFAELFELAEAASKTDGPKVAIAA